MSNFYQFSATQAPKKVFLDRQVPLQYGALHQLIGQFTAYLKTTALTAGDRVVISCNDDAYLAMIFFTLIDNGITAVIASSDMTVSEFSALCQITQATGCILDADTIQRCIPEQNDFKLVLPIAKAAKKKNLLSKLIKKKQAQESSAFPSLLNNFQPEAPSLDFSIERIAYIMLTSGSTAQPKAVPTTWKALNTHLGTLKKQFHYDSESRILNILPLFHADGLIQGAALACFNGATWVRPFLFSIQNIEPLLHTIYRRQVTHFICVPTILSLILRLGAPLKDSFISDDFKFIISAAGNLDKKLWQDFQSNFNVTISNMYGLTETVTGGIFSGPEKHNHKIGSIGKPVDCEVMIVDKHDQVIQGSESGELLLRGDNVFSGYLNSEELNQTLFLDGWMRTGDLAYKDAEGFFYMTGRIKSVVISGGENIYPEEVTEVITAHPAVHEAITFGIANAEWGETLVALVVPTATENYDENELINWCRESLSNYKVPKIWQRVDELPYGPSGKILLSEAKKLYKNNSASSSLENDNDIDNKIIALAATIFHCPVESLTAYSAVTDTIGWDSLAHISLVVALEAEFNIKISTAEIMQIESLKTAMNIVKEKYPTL